MAGTEDRRSSSNNRRLVSGIRGKYIGLGALEKVDNDEVIDGTGLLGGLKVFELRILCENPWNGGGGYTPEQVGDMTLDQVWFRLCDKDNLKKDIGTRTQKSGSLNALDLVKADKDGKIAGRDKDGNPIRSKVVGVSKARQLMNKRMGERREENRKEREERIKEKKKHKR